MTSSLENFFNNLPPEIVEELRNKLTTSSIDQMHSNAAVICKLLNFDKYIVEFENYSDDKQTMQVGYDKLKTRNPEFIRAKLKKKSGGKVKKIYQRPTGIEFDFDIEDTEFTNIHLCNTTNIHEIIELLDSLDTSKDENWRNNPYYTRERLCQEEESTPPTQ